MDKIRIITKEIDTIINKITTDKTTIETTIIKIEINIIEDQIIIKIITKTIKNNCPI